MKITPTSIPDVLIIEPKVFGDERGFFYESFNQKIWNKKTDLNTVFVQDNHSCSIKNVLRGLHYQIQHPQGKLVRVIKGEVFDVAVDIRKSSPTFGKWVGMALSAENKLQMWVPEGFAHGFQTLSDNSGLIYHHTESYVPGAEGGIRYDDPRVGIHWPLPVAVISGRDAQHSYLDNQFKGI